MKRGTLITFEVPNEAALELELNEGETMDAYYDGSSVYVSAREVEREMDCCCCRCKRNSFAE